MPQGRIKTIHKGQERAMAIIAYDKDDKLIIYRSGIDIINSESLSIGNKVRFETINTPMGFEATNVYNVK